MRNQLAQKLLSNPLKLNQKSKNMPNPFNNNTIVEFELDKQMEVSFEVLDITGKVVKVLNLGNMGVGTHQK